jgi:hypothetical protein
MTVVLADLPVQLFWTFDEQAGALLREYELGALAGAGHAFSADDVADANQIRQLLAARVARAFGRRRTPDVTIRLLDVDKAAFGRLKAVLDDADTRARAGHMLSPPALPEVVALRDWMCGQVVSQSAGERAQPWPGGPR